MARVWDDATIARIRENMFPPAHAAIADWARFPWHRHATSPRSSQVLAIDLFGVLKTHPERAAIGAAIARAFDLPDAGPWAFELEWSDPDNALRELAPTMVDAVAFGADSTILFECKFAEAGGRCSQTMPGEGRPAQCNGAHVVQTNPVNSVTARCALSGKGIRYWEFAQEIFGIDPAADHAPCPFANDAYQWMRNVVMAKSLAETTGKATRVAAAYADAPYLQTARKARSGLLGLQTKGAYAIRPVSYEEIITIAEAAAPSPLWQSLRAWQRRKIEAVQP